MFSAFTQLWCATGLSPDTAHLCLQKHTRGILRGKSNNYLLKCFATWEHGSFLKWRGKQSSISAEREVFSKIAPAAGAGGQESGANPEPNQTRSGPGSLIHHFNEHPVLVATNNFMFTARYKEIKTELQKLFMYFPDLLGIGTVKCLFIAPALIFVLCSQTNEGCLASFS